MEQGGDFVQAQHFLGGVALVTLRPAFQELFHDWKGEGRTVSFDVLGQAEDKGLVIELQDWDLVPPFVHVIVVVQREEEGKEEVTVDAGKRSSEALDDLSKHLQQRRHGHVLLPRIDERGEKTGDERTEQGPGGREVPVEQMQKLAQKRVFTLRGGVEAGEDRAEHFGSHGLDGCLWVVFRHGHEVGEEGLGLPDHVGSAVFPGGPEEVEKEGVGRAIELVAVVPQFVAGLQAQELGEGQGLEEKKVGVG